MAYELQRLRTGDPFDTVQDQALQMFRQILSGGQQRRQQGDRQGVIVPPAEAIEDENSYIVSLEVPGVDPREVEVSVMGNTLAIKAERRQQHGIEQQGQQTQQGQQGQRARHILFSELSQGQVRREFTLPEDADRNRINAEFRNGLLTLTVQKSQETHQRRKIDIKSN